MGLYSIMLNKKFIPHCNLTKSFVLFFQKNRCLIRPDWFWKKPIWIYQAKLPYYVISLQRNIYNTKDTKDTKDINSLNIAII